MERPTSLSLSFCISWFSKPTGCRKLVLDSLKMWYSCNAFCTEGTLPCNRQPLFRLSLTFGSLWITESDNTLSKLDEAML